MRKKTKWIVLILGIGLLVTLVGVVSAFSITSIARAQDAAVQHWNVGSIVQRSIEGHPGVPGDFNQFLADELGISVEELQAAQEEAFNAGIQKSVEKGLITEEQAEAIKSHQFGFKRGFIQGFKLGRLSAGKGFDNSALLAEALGIEVEELQAAQDRAHEAALEQAVEDGLISEEALEMIKARQALREYLDPQEMLAQALGVDVDQLEAYREEGKPMSEILDELGLTPTEVREAQQAAFENALQDAVTDGVITQEQADLIQNSHSGADRGGFFGHGRHDRMKPPGGPWDGMPDGSRFETPSEDTGTSL